MPVTSPTDALPYIRAIQLLLGGYGAYSREKRRETDVAVREEVARAATRVRNHLNNVHDAAYRSKDIELAGACSRAIEEVDGLRNEVELAATGGEHPFFSLQKSASKKTINNLIKHRSEEHTSELQSRRNLVCRLLLEKKNSKKK